MLLASLIGIGAVWPSTARATVDPGCSPVLRTLAPTVPANLPSFLFELVAPGPAPSIRFLRDDGQGGAVDVPLTVKAVDASQRAYLAIPSSLTVGATHRFEFANGCDDGGASFLVGPAAPMPTTLGVLQALPKQRFDDLGWRREIIPLPLAVDPSVAPWKDLYIDEVMVDGAVHAAGVGIDENYGISVCGWNSTDVQHGRHTVAIAGRPIGFDAPRVESNAVVVDVVCPMDWGPGPTRTPAPPSSGIDEVPALDAGGCAVATAPSSVGSSLPRSAATTGAAVFAFVVFRRWRRATKR